ncbi:hypothetical protein CERSUDRAFT_90181 [Gelatoporia subvermispora B]|uniref:Mediator of RNA polymerase II transcription subunit 9 n=1 Tax=Ceriporiopsis subvermispora (strain B) TaxID=914234 RepID=M2RT35_CERS8|nr:hypothetical protein CERSUDRAFT_90181 [Gelatoporia subvermispora B]
MSNTAQFETLVPKLATVLERAQQAEEGLTPQTKQALVAATNDFKDSIRAAREAARALPGGELALAEQDAVLEMLERLRARKRRQLEAFAERVAAAAEAAAAHARTDDQSVNMEVDSTASTPFA